MIYHHRSIHQRNQPSCIWDDYPYNVGLSRKLQPASRLALNTKVVCKNEGRLEVVFWIDGQMVGVTCDVDGQRELNISSDDAVAVEVARRNAEQNGLAHELAFEKRDLTKMPLGGRQFDVVCANYISLNHESFQFYFL